MWSSGSVTVPTPPVGGPPTAARDRPPRRAAPSDRRGGIEGSCLAPVEDQVPFGEEPAVADLGERVEVAKGGDHDPADTVLAEEVVGDGVALAGCTVTFDDNRALPVEMRRRVVLVQVGE